jgi:hypothetical protein
MPQTGSGAAENLDVNFVTKQWQDIFDGSAVLE